MDHLAFKGGTCLRKTVFGSSGRFSEDLDFTFDSDKPVDSSFGGDVKYRHSWNDTGRFRLQVSLRERPTLDRTHRPLMDQPYFKYLEFQPSPVRSLAVIEMIAEKVRAALQRAKVRDLYDLHRFATTPFDGDRLRRLAALKLWLGRSPTPHANRSAAELRRDHPDGRRPVQRPP